MTIELIPVGGFTEVGKNMTAVRVGEEIIIIDMGFFLPALVNFEEEGGDRRTLNREGLINIHAIPDDTILHPFKEHVKAIVLSHCHLDHIGATPWLAPHYPQAPIIGTPYTMQVLNNAIQEDKTNLKNPRIPVNPNGKITISKTITIELIQVTHSTIHTAVVAIHTPEGTVLYANDYKFDSTPVVGATANTKRLRELGTENVRCLVSNSLYSNSEGKTPSEKVAREMLKEVLLGTENHTSAVFATTFASHIARLTSLYDFGQKLDRKVVFLGRSMLKYVKAAEQLGMIKYPHAEIIGYADKIQKKLKEIQKHPSKYLVVCTGGQGEPQSVLSKITNGVLPFSFQKEDHIIFSNNVIPVPINLQNRGDLEQKLKQRGVRIFNKIHVSGHGSKEDIRDMIKLTKPQLLVPTHGYPQMYTGVKELAGEMGYELGKTIRIAKNSVKMTI